MNKLEKIALEKLEQEVQKIVNLTSGKNKDHIQRSQPEILDTAVIALDIIQILREYKP